MGGLGAVEELLDVTVGFWTGHDSHHLNKMGEGVSGTLKTMR